MRSTQDGTNGKESTVNKALGGSTYPGLKLVRSSLCKFFLVVMKHSTLFLGLVLPSGGLQSLIKSATCCQKRNYNETFDQALLF
jgi:hypothetical protein